MKLLCHLFFVLIGFSTSCSGALAEVTLPKEIVDWPEVHNISVISTHAHTPELKGVFLIDADEVLFTTTVVEGEARLVRLHDDLEGVFSKIRESGHSVYILTYNKADEIRSKLSRVKLDERYFDGILSCEMEGDVMTAKGELLRRHVSASKTRYDFAVFIDNFPPFVQNVQCVARELGLTLHPYLCTGYIDLYHEYVYYHLSKLQKDSAEGGEPSHELRRINKSLTKYGIDIKRFTGQYPDVAIFIAWAKQQALIWPYLTYL